MSAIAADLPFRRPRVWVWITPVILGLIMQMGFFVVRSSGGAVGSCAGIWIAQSSAGAADGSSEVNPRAVTYFNTSANWGGGGAEIDAGDTVCLTGTITSALDFKGSGSSGNYITLDGTNATLSAVEVTITARSWIKVQNLTWASGMTTTNLSLEGATNIIADNLYSDDMQGYAVFMGQNGGTALCDEITIRNSYFRTTTANLGDTEHDIIASEGATDVLIEGNYLEQRTAGAGPNAHNDVFQTWQRGGTSAGNPARWTIRYNYAVMNSVEANDRSWSILQQLSGDNKFYRNVFVGINGASSANGLVVYDSFNSGTTYKFYNNTVVAKSSASNNTVRFLEIGSVDVKNNVVYGASGQQLYPGDMTTTRSYNLWWGTGAPSAAGGSNEISGSTSTEDPDFTDYTNNDFSLQAGSPAEDSGTNLGSPYDMALSPTATWPNPTLVAVTGSWDRGAYQR